MKKQGAVARVRRGEQYWREQIERQRSSGLSQAAFCQREAVPLSTFTYWCRRLRDEPVSTANRIEFIEVGSRIAEPSAALLIRLDLGGGAVLEIRRG